jgi:hypothetical protein
MWKIEKIVSKGDYNYYVVRNHPSCTKHGYVLHHRVVVENHLGRLLDPTEVVHHLNGDKKDNRVDNLRVMDEADHARVHGYEQGARFVELKCPSCGVLFHRPRRQTHLVKPTKYATCSSSCRGKFSREIQLHGLTHKVEEAISENIVREYTKYSHDNSEQTI